MKLHWKNTLGGLALLAMAIPAWAHTDSLPYVTTQTTTIDGYKLAPGTYTLDASDTTNQVEVRKNGNIIATVPCKWVQLKEKANESEVFSNNSKVTELEFSGKTEAATLTR